MRDGNGKVGIGLLMGVVLGLTLGACGGGAQEQREPTWTPRERAVSVADDRWWRDPVERACEEDDDCLTGEVCQNMQLGTCDGCPEGEVTRICVDPDGAQASSD